MSSGPEENQNCQTQMWKKLEIDVKQVLNLIEKVRMYCNSNDAENGNSVPLNPDNLSC
ncbi:hypothetical protein CU097_014037 [Rhizopus azygosporus]|uniref:Uncharacterized protein n=1 Tax=Rhizopus azygosporus TaxID=86630 RepID=A0A367K639_RHIAZ|nr:hypothetical protein CU097_014037 [Rhizopus azygosporus]